jgi:hypothetical protein
MGVLTDLIVAPLADTAPIASTASKERPWPWKDVKGIGVDDLATILCLLDGHDPHAPVTPSEWVKNPFTKKKVAVTAVGRRMREFEAVAEDGEVVVFRVPRALVEGLAALQVTGVADLARRWSVDKSSERYGDGRRVQPFPEETAAAYLAEIVAMARKAVDERQELFVWMSP